MLAYGCVTKVDYNRVYTFTSMLLELQNSLTILNEVHLLITRVIQKVSSGFKYCHWIDAVTLLHMRGQFVDSLASQQHHL